MQDLIAFRRGWSKRQKTLRDLLKAGSDLDRARDLFYRQHAVLHSGEMSGLDGWSYADAIFSGLEDGQFRRIPEKEDHSLIWILWHMSRIEDVTMNILVAGDTQIYLKDQWKGNLKSPIDHVGNQGSMENLIKLTRDIDLGELFRYRNAVGRKTRSIVRGLQAENLGKKVEPDRLQRLVNEGAVLPQADALLAYWGKRKIFEMLLMPPTRHLMTHLNEANALLKAINRM